MRLPLRHLPLALLSMALAIAEAQTPPPAAPLPKPSPAQLAWQQAELVAMFCLDPRSYHPRTGGENIQNVHLGEEKARAYAEAFNPDKLDTDQWIRSAKDMGATAAVLVAKHEVGFCLWQSDANPYSLKMLKWRDGKGDIMRDFVASCRKYGLKPGVFTTTRFDNRLGVHLSAPMKSATITRAQYNRLVEAETEELLSRYGELFELWLDGSARTPAQGGPDLVPIFERHQPATAIFYHSDDRRDVRWGGTESGTVGDPCWSTVKDRNKMNWGTGSPDGAFWCPAMADIPLRAANGRHDWFWWPAAEKGVLPLNSLKNIYLNSVGRNATLVIGLTPDLSGLLPQPDADRCREFGAWRQQTFGGAPLARTGGTGTTLALDLPEAARKAGLFVVLAEDIREGERVREYVLEREVEGRWIECRKGTNIGHKRIVRVKPEGATRLRLTVSRSIAEPILADFSVFAE